MAKKKTSAALFDWGDGKGKIHTIPKNIHGQNLEAARYGINLNAPASQTLDNRGAYGLAQQQAGLQYDPQIKAAQQAGVNAQSWFQNYVDQVKGAQTAAQSYAAPILAQAQQWANAPAQAAPGIDPNSQAAQQSQQAASSGQNLAQLGYTTLAAIPVTANNYMAGLQTTAAGQVPVAQQYYGQQAAQLQGQKGQAVGANYATNRANEQNAQIAYGTLGLNTQKASDDAAYDAATVKQKATDTATKAQEKAETPNKYGIPAAQWNKWSSSHRQRVIDKYNSDNSKTDTTAADEKKQAKIQAATGKVRNKVTDIINDWDKGGSVDVTDPKTGNVTGTRKATPAEVRTAIIDKYGFMGRVALAVREGKPLDQKAVDYLHNLDPNFRIPREWLGKKSETSSGVSDEKSRGGTKQDPYGSGPGHH